jgi:crotonobetainyl-CoA:carnitine CoA-transferase CaiB-like acyl-CoA transferase
VSSSSTQGPPHAAGALAGVRVLDFSQVLAGPTVTRLMAEFGADVIKVEPAAGEMSRYLPFVRDGRSGYFIQQNRGKRSLCVDLKQPEGRELVTRLLPEIDVVVENFRPGVLARLGFGWERLQEINPRIVLCSISALGQEGELSGKPGYDTVGAAYTGIAYMSGTPEGGPAMPTPAIGDSMTGICGYGAVLTALMERERTGRGRWVEASLVDAYMQAHEISVQMVSGSGGALHPEPAGPYNKTMMPAGTFPVRGRHVFIACVGRAEWGRLCAAMERPELTDDPRYVDNDARVAHWQEVIDLVEAWLDGCSDHLAAVAALEAHQVPCALVLSVEEAMALPHHRARGTMRTVNDRVWGTLDLPGSPIRFVGTDQDPDLAAPFLGEHNAEILRELLALEPAEVDRLAAAGVLHREDACPS